MGKTSSAAKFVLPGFWKYCWGVKAVLKLISTWVLNYPSNEQYEICRMQIMCKCKNFETLNAIKDHWSCFRTREFGGALMFNK